MLLIVNIIIAGLVCVILFLVCGAVLGELAADARWQKINKLIWLLVFLIWLLSIVFARTFVVIPLRQL